ncbi:MAG: 2OG-Fe(II) oxygenase [Chromatiales bacterium]|jgi:Rps23 Pro-64 3,4-dihydroxylase Tpa1-like proline 4-hydroxylase|nr:2OG-Fe(II) oxygenase [Chromatiales bacterium]
MGDTTNTSEFIDYLSLESRTSNLSESFTDAKPHKHIIVDRLLATSVAEKAAHVFPSLATMEALNDFRQHRAQDPNLDKFEVIFQQVIKEHLHSARFVRWVEEISGISNLRTDDQLYAAGLAQSGHGGYLNVHIDNSSHPTLPCYRRLNLLVYLNQNWLDENGGHLELWSQNMDASVSILPTFNRMALCETHQASWDGIDG